ncbi:MAG: ASKHA domain-containing protein [Butyrivibrio sp.]|uniref:ASKHA domain-containing protein n=1 Tax=Butyrivibrio sp. TaxID=28121 RepID=UPI0025FF3647|nr:ASKHA domain-containing protein [Butyrivibrio sp.]MCR5770594.1 ASKHA domain-containing protein [Butyrivibrio sp.]
MRRSNEITVKVHMNVADNEPLVLHALKGKKLLDLLRDNDIRIDSPCSGSGTCGKCRVRFLDENARITTADMRHISKEDLEKGYRLACMSMLTSDAEICINSFDENNIEVLGAGTDLRKKADKYKKYGIGIDIGTTTLAAALIELPCDITTDMHKASDLHRSNDTNKSSDMYNTSKNGSSDILKSSSEDPDSDKKKGFNKEKIQGFEFEDSIIGVATGINHQRSYGTDVISRIKASKDKKRRLQEQIQTDIENLIRELLIKTGCSISQITGIAIAGNTTMLHLLRGYDCESLGVYPYTPVNIDAEYLKLKDICPSVNKGKKAYINDIPVTIMPGFSAFVGADILSGLYAQHPFKDHPEFLFLDLGTNGEMAAGEGDKLYITSTAAGPVFEGGGIRYGIPGIPGAISGAFFKDGKLHITTIGDERPIGICGTGVLEIVSALIREGIIDKTGLLQKEYFESGYPVCKAEDGSDIVITQNDIRQVQMAKAAVNVALQMIYEKMKSKASDITGLKALNLKNADNRDDLQKAYKEKDIKPYVIISGGFGVKLSLNRIKELKMFPDCITENGDNIYIAGNTSLKGCVRYLCIEALYGTKIAREALNVIQKSAQEVELSQDDAFSDMYYEAMNF